MEIVLYTHIHVKLLLFIYSFRNSINRGRNINWSGKTKLDELKTMTWTLTNDFFV